MKQFNFHYDSENDDLFVYLKGTRSDGAVEAGNFILDFNKKEELVAIEIAEASQVMKAVLSRIIELSSIKEFKAEMTKFRNIASIRFSITDKSGQETANILIPRIMRNSPTLKTV